MFPHNPLHRARTNTNIFSIHHGKVAAALSGSGCSFARTVTSAAARQADSIGDAYIVVCLGGSDGEPPPAAGRSELLSLALAMLRAVAQVDAKAAAEARVAGRAGEDSLAGRLRVRIGVAEGDVIAGLTGAHQQRYQFFGTAVVRAEYHQRRAQPGEVRVQAAVAAAAAAADCFMFSFSDPEGGRHGPLDAANEHDRYGRAVVQDWLLSKAAAV